MAQGQKRLDRLPRQDQFDLSAWHAGARDPGHLEEMYGIEGYTAPVSNVTEALVKEG